MAITLPAHTVMATLLRDGQLTLEGLPFHAGQPVEVIIVPQSAVAMGSSVYPLRGTPVHYDRPTDPVADEEWDALR